VSLQFAPYLAGGEQLTPALHPAPHPRPHLVPLRIVPQVVPHLGRLEGVGAHLGVLRGRCARQPLQGMGGKGKMQGPRTARETEPAQHISGLQGGTAAAQSVALPSCPLDVLRMHGQHRQARTCHAPAPTSSWLVML
jgi:hypothetical protein